MQGEGDGDCAAGESGGSEGGAERSGKVNLAAAVLLAALAAPDAADQQRVSARADKYGIQYIYIIYKYTYNTIYMGARSRIFCISFRFVSLWATSHTVETTQPVP